jgi:plasmid stabilization system protein ParE
LSSYVLGTEADLDLDEIWEYIAADSVDAADRWIQRLFDCFDELARSPNAGHVREDLTAYPVRFWTVGAYLVIYRAHTVPVEIVAVTEASRDVPKLLSHRHGSVGAAGVE